MFSPLFVLMLLIRLFVDNTRAENVIKMQVEKDLETLYVYRGSERSCSVMIDEDEKEGSD